MGRGHRVRRPREGGEERMYVVVEVPSASPTGYTAGVSLSTDDYVVGIDFPAVGPVTGSAFLSHDLVTQDLTNLGADAIAASRNESGAIVGWFLDMNADPQTNQRAFLLGTPSGNPIAIQPLLPSSALSSGATDINDSQVIVGTYLAPPQSSGLSWEHGFVYNAVTNEVISLDTLNQGIAGATAINNQHQIIGGKHGGGGFLYELTSAAFHSLSFTPTALNDAGLIVGKVNDATSVMRVGTSVETLPSFGGDYFVATGVNSAGSIVGYGTFNSGPHGTSDFHGFVSDGFQTVNLNDSLAPGSTQWHVSGAVAINDLGHILGRARRSVDHVDRTVILLPAPDKAKLPLTSAFAEIFGGVASDGGGFAFYGGRFHVVPPRDPEGLLNAAQREVVAGLMIGEIAGLLDNAAARRELRSAATRLVVQGGQRLYSPIGGGGVERALNIEPAAGIPQRRASFLAAMEQRTLKLSRPR